MTRRQPQQLAHEPHHDPLATPHPRHEHPFAIHLQQPVGRGHVPKQAASGAAGGAACGDLIGISLRLAQDSGAGEIEDAGFEASGCGATLAAGSATVSLIRGVPLLDAARIGAPEIEAELGGLTPGKRHAAELAADALHRALGLAARGAALEPVPARTLVAMSGGVDSAVAALLETRRGGQVLAVTLELWADPANDGERSCCSAQAVRTARALAHRLQLPHFSIDLRREFAAGVVQPWLADHAAGLTPYACVRCNGQVRLDGMLELARALGADTLATGHYARVHRPGEAREVDAAEDQPLLRVAADTRKDQSYALAALAPRSLARLRFPLGAMHKEQVRQLARDAQLPVAAKRDSQDLCFLAGTDERSFLARHGEIHARTGPILDQDGTVLGRHHGVRDFTIGQRRGLRLGGGPQRFVLATDAQANTVTVGPRHALLSETVELRDAVLRIDAEHVDAVKIRYRGARLRCQPPSPSHAGRHQRLTLRLARPVERTAPGQLACLYSGDLLVGHGTIAA